MNEKPSIITNLTPPIEVPKKPPIIHPTQVDQASPMLRDFFQGDDKLYEQLDSQFDTETIEKALEFLIHNPNLTTSEVLDIVQNPWKFSYNLKPPTINEFMSAKYLGETGDNIFDYWRPIMDTFWAPDSTYRHLILSMFIGAGKSFISSISSMYQSYIYFLKRNPKREMGLAPASIVCNVAFSFTQDKAQELLIEPIINILESSPMYQKERTIEKMRQNQKESGPGVVHWTTAGKTSAISYGASGGGEGLHTKCLANPEKFLGLSILGGTMSELSFFTDRGYSDEYIMKCLTTLRGRIYSRFGNDNPLAFSVVDSSPNSLTSELDRYIYNGEADNEQAAFMIGGKQVQRNITMVCKGAYYDFKTSEIDHPEITFPIFTGNSSAEPAIISEDIVDSYDITEVIRVPSELKNLYESDLIRALKDVSGIPAGSSNLFITNKSCIEDCFKPGLKTILGSLIADSMDEPENLLWNQIKDIFFVKANGIYQFWRNPSELRYISVDQAEKNDCLGFCVVHKELDPQGKEVYIVDMNLAVLANGAKINLDSIRELILDLKTLGNLHIDQLSFDQFQSSPNIQWLERKGFNVNKLSVETSMEPYMYLLNLLSTGRLKSGKNIYLKNNLKSLILTSNKTRQKVDHIIQPTSSLRSNENLNWDTSKSGYGANDVSDALAAAIFNCHTKMSVTPKFVYNEDELDILDPEMNRDTRKEKLLKKIQREKGLVVK